MVGSILGPYIRFYAPDNRVFNRLWGNRGIRRDHDPNNGESDGEGHGRWHVNCRFTGICGVSGSSFAGYE